MRSVIITTLCDQYALLRLCSKFGSPVCSSLVLIVDLPAGGNIQPVLPAPIPGTCIVHINYVVYVCPF